MKKLFSFLVLGFFIFQISNPLVIYASLEDTLEEVKQETSAKLDTLEVIADKTIATLDAKTSNQEIESQLEEKSQEIEVYLEEVQAEVQDASSQTEVTQILEEAKKVVVLKVVAGATEYSDIEEGLPKGEALTPSEKEIALETLQESIEQETTFTLMIATKYSQSQVQTLLSKFDAQIEVKLLYISDDTNYFQLTISQQSIFAQEILQDIQDGTIPESFVGIEIIQPEVFTLENLTPNPLLVGEGVDSTWGIKSYNPVEYIDLTSTFSSRIKVGIVDTGIQLNHPDLAGNISPTLGYDFVNDDSDASDDQGHGTHVAGTIGAMNNGSGIIGVNPNVELVPLKICNASGFCPSYAIIKAIDYAKTHHIPVLNMSLGGRGTVTDNPICAGIDALTAQGTIVVSAAGNSNVDTSTFVPGGCPSALTVGAYDQLQKRASFSNYGAKVDVSAPGVSIYSTHLNSGYKNLSGTSMATPHIVGVVSLLKSLKPSITRSEVISLFNQHKVLLNAEVGKSIASGVDLIGVIQSLTLSQAENQTPPPVTNTDESEEVSSALSTPTQTPASDVVLNPNIEFVPNQEAKALEVEAKNAELISQAQQETETVGIANVVLDFLGLGSRTEINSLGENLSTPEEQVLPLTQEPYKGAYQIADVQYFDENGNPLSDVAIANVEDEVGEVLTLNQIPFGELPTYNGEENTDEPAIILDDPKEELKMHELLIDGAQKPVSISSIDDTSSETFEIQEYEPLAENTFIDENGDVVDMTQGEILDIPVEHFDYSFENEIFVDGATRESFINSVGDEGLDPLSMEDTDIETSITTSESAEPVEQIIEPNFEEQFFQNQSEEILVQDFATGSYISSTDDAFIIPDALGIQDVLSPISTSSIYHVFSPIQDTTYRSYIQNGATKYTLSATTRGTIVGQKMEAKTTDNFIYAYTQNNYNYGAQVSPQTFYGKMRANFASTTTGWNQFSHMGIAGTTDEMLMGAYAFTYQASAVNYSKNQGKDDLCVPNTVIDEVKCINHTFVAGKYILLFYKKSNGKYTRVSYKLPDTLSGEYDVEYTLDFVNNKLIAKVMSLTGVVEQQITSDITGVTSPTGIDFSNFTYYAGAGTTNNSAQFNTPYEIGVSFAPPPPPPSLLPDAPTLLSYDMTTSGVVKYGWQDVSNEDTYVMKDEQGNTIGTQLVSGTQYMEETGLQAGVTYSRKICSMNGGGEACSPLISFSLPTEVPLSMYRTKQVVYPVTNASSYQYTFSEVGKLSLSATGIYNVFITGNVEGQHRVYAKLNGVHKYTFIVDVLPWPEPQVITATVPELQSITVYLPTGSYQVTRLTTSTGSASTSTSSSGPIYITGSTKGVVSYSIAPKTGTMSYIPAYILNVTVTPAIPTITTRTVWETRGWTDNTLKAGTLSYSEAGIVSGAVVYGDLDFKALKAGYVEIYLKDSYGRHLRTEQVTVLPKPIPQTYTYDLLIEESLSVTLPEPIANYNITVENVALFGSSWTSAAIGNTFNLNTVNNGTAVIHLVDKTNAFDKYVITVNVKPREIYYTLNVTDKIDIYYNSNRTYSNLNPDIFSRSGTYVTGLKAGQGIMHATYGGVLKYIYYFTVNPIPEPKQIYCNTLAGSSCWVSVNYASYSYSVSNSTVLNRIEKTGSGIRVYTNSSGIVTLYLKSVTGQYTSHILTVNVASKPPLEFTCEVPLGYSCLSYESNVNTGFSFTSTNPSTTNVALLSFPAPGPLASPYYQYKITGLTEGVSDIYIYRYSDHVATVHTTILPPVTPLSLQTSNRTIKEGEVIRGTLSGGAAPYSMKSVKYVDAQGNETTSTDLYTSVGQTTGEVTITAKQRPGNYTVELKDKYDQTVKFGVTVLDALLTLGAPAVLTPDRYTLSMEVGDNITVPIKDYYVGLQSITQDTNHVRRTIIDIPDPDQPQKPKKYLQLEALEGGQTKFEILDGENTKVVLVVSVTGAPIDINPSLPVGEIRLSNLEFDSLGNLGVGLLTFQAIGDVKEISIRYIEETGDETIEALTLEVDGNYSIPLNKYDFTKIYTSFQLSLKDTFGNSTTSAIIPFSTSTHINQYNEGESLEVNEVNSDTYTRIDNAIIKIEDELKLKKIKTLAQAIIFKINITTLPTNQKADLLAVLNHINTRLQQQLNSLVLKITKIQYTATVEDGYIGGFYFKVNAPSQIQDAGIEYYNGTTSQMPGNAVWKPIILENEGDGEFAAFILPQTKYTFVRGYVVDNNGQKSYTRTYGNLITAGSSIQDYYNLEAGKIIASESEYQGVEINAIQIPVLIFFGAIGVGIVANHFCEINGGKWYLPSTWVEENTINFSCAIEAGTVVVPVIQFGASTLAWAKTSVSNFSSKTLLELFVPKLGKEIDDIAIIGPNSALKAKFWTWLGNSEADTLVYIGYNTEGRAVYVGITKDIVARQAQHIASGKNITIRQIPGTSNLTRNQARTIEQNIINSNSIEFDENAINSIAEGRDIYDEAIKWGADFMRSNNIKFTGY